MKIENTEEHLEWHHHMHELGARIFFTRSQGIVSAFGNGITLGEFDINSNKEISKDANRNTGTTDSTHREPEP